MNGRGMREMRARKRLHLADINSNQSQRASEELQSYQGTWKAQNHNWILNLRFPALWRRVISGSSLSTL